MSGIALVISWPETKCRQADSWYDPVMKILGVNKDSYYKIGHAAIVLIEIKTQNCTYYDFGRYNTPKQIGRIRHRETDENFNLSTQARFESNKLVNAWDILNEIQNIPEKKGDGVLIAKEVEINFQDALAALKPLIEQNFYSYGPFLRRGLNCSRFVAKVLKKSCKSIKGRLVYSAAISPSPKGLLLRSMGPTHKVFPNAFSKEDMDPINEATKTAQRH